jgi:hypothetical protein
VWVTHTYNATYLESWNGEDCSSRSAQANSSWDPHLQINQSNMDWKSVSSDREPVSDREPALQMWSLKFKPQFHQTKQIK